MFIFSHVLGNTLFYVSGILSKHTMSGLVQISLEFYEHVVCSAFYRVHISIKKNKKNMKLHILIGFLCMIEYDV